MAIGSLSSEGSGSDSFGVLNQSYSGLIEFKIEPKWMNEWMSRLVNRKPT
jgi:hypothetical protein